MLLRAGARVIVTHALPARRRAPLRREPDFEAFRDRLQIYGLDLRHTPSVEALRARPVAARDPPRLRPQQRLPDGAAAAGVLRALSMDRSWRRCRSLSSQARSLLRDHEAMRESSAGLVMRGSPAPSRAGLLAAPELSQLPLTAEDHQFHNAGVSLFPEGALDADLQQVDLRTINSWRLTLADVPHGGAARGAPGQRHRAVRAERAAQAADAAAPLHATSTSSTSRRWRASSTGATRPTSTRTRTWPRPRST